MCNILQHVDWTYNVPMPHFLQWCNACQWYLLCLTDIILNKPAGTLFHFHSFTSGASSVHQALNVKASKKKSTYVLIHEAMIQRLVWHHKALEKVSKKKKKKKKKGSGPGQHLHSVFLKCTLWLNKFSQSIILIINVLEALSPPPRPLVSPTYHTLALPLLFELLKGVVSVSCAPRSLEGVGDLSARRALNNREGRNKRNKHHKPSVLLQRRGDTGITMPEPVPEGMQILFVKA